MNKETFLFFIFLFLILSFSTSIPQVTVNDSIKINELIKRIDSLEGKLETQNAIIETYRKELDNYNNLQKENVEKLKDSMDVLDRFSAKSIALASLIVCALGLFFSLVSLYFYHQARVDEKEIKNSVNEFDKTLEEAKRKVNADQAKALEELEHSKTENINKLEDTKTKIIKEFEIYENKIDKLRIDADSLSKEFSIVMYNKLELLSELAREVSAKIGREIPESERIAILDKIFKEKLNKYTIESLKSDLISDYKEEQERAIWALEEMGPELIGKQETMRILQEVVDNSEYDPEIRLQAQRSIDNINTKK